MSDHETTPGTPSPGDGSDGGVPSVGEGSSTPPEPHKQPDGGASSPGVSPSGVDRPPAPGGPPADTGPGEGASTPSPGRWHHPPKISREDHGTPVCDSVWSDPAHDYATYTCTRVKGHPPKHEAGAGFLMDGSVEVVASW